MGLEMMELTLYPILMGVGVSILAKAHWLMQNSVVSCKMQPFFCFFLVL